MGSADLRQIAYWSASDDVLPSGARSPWDAVGGGGTLLASGVQITSAATRKGYRRLTADRRVHDRIELQAEFTGATNAPTWASGSPGNMLWIDDGHRAVGLAIGDLLAVVDPTDGTVLAVIPREDQPGGWTSLQSYQLIKDGTSTWDVVVSGRLIFRLPYIAGADSTLSVAAMGFGWQDATTSSAGSGTWNRVEVAINEILPPHWKVDKARFGMGPALLAEWTPRHEAFLRATVGLAHAAQDAMARARELFTAQVLPVQQGSFSGEDDPTSDGWAIVGTGALSTVRERQRIATTTDATYAEWTWDTPVQTDAVYYAAARFLLVDWTNFDTIGRLGPFLQIFDGNLRIGAFLRKDLSNPDAIGWMLSNSAPGDSTFAETGDTIFRVDPRVESLVELYVIGQERVLLFVDGDIVEDVPYSRFDALSAATTDYKVDIGSDGAVGAISATVDLTDAVAAIRYGANDRRAEFLRRVAERLLFASGCERNDVLDAWMRHRPGVFRARGTDRVLSEVRRIACDDDAELIVDVEPAAWFLEVTWPDITPVFLVDADTSVQVSTVEYRIDAPNFLPDPLSKLIRRYLIPRSVLEARFTAFLITDITTDPSFTTIPPGVVASEFDVARTLGFAVGDDVTIRQWSADTLLTLQYDTSGTGAADVMNVGVDHGRVWSSWQVAWSGQAGSTLVGGSATLTGKDGDRLAAVTAGGTIKLKGSSGAVELYAEVFGIETGTGAAIMRRYHVVGTADVTDATLWAEVHGVISDRAAQAAFSVIDVTGAATLYTVALGSRASGCYLFDPPLLCGPSTLSVTPDGATTKKMVAWGVEQNTDETGAKLTLAGVIPQVTSTVFSAIRVLAVGYVEAARTLFTYARLCDPGGSIHIQSNNAADTMVFRVYAVSTLGEARFWEGTLTGTTAVLLDDSTGLWHVLGIQLFEDAVGTINVTMTGGSQTVSVCALSTGERLKGVKVAGIEAIGEVGIAAPGVLATPAWILVYGLDAAGVPQAGVRRLDSEARMAFDESWSEIQAFVAGGVPTTTDLTFDGIGWRFDGANDVLSYLDGRLLWTSTGPPGGETALDGKLDDAIATDVTSGPTDFTGRFSISEETVILAIDGNTVDTELLSGTYTAGAIMRKI